MGTQNYLIDQLTNRGIDINKAAKTAAAQASSGLFSLYRDIMQRLKEEPTSRWYRLSGDVEALLINEMRGAVAQVKSDLGELAPIETKFAENILLYATTLDTVSRLPESILATFSTSPMNNFVVGGNVVETTTDELLNTLVDKNPRTVRNMIRSAALEGKTAAQISSDIRKIAVNASRRDIESVTITTFNHYSNQAHDAVYAQNADILDGVKLSATLDSKTTLTCMGYDGKVFPLREGPRPPFHYRCRTYAVPMVSEAFRLNNIEGATRASEGGPVSAQLTYQGFLKRQSKERQIEILGPKRAKLFRQGMPVDRFTDSDGVVISIRDLPERY